MAHILVVDDEPEIRYAIGRAVEAMGHVVTEATGQHDSAPILTTESVDLVICDLQLPSMTALDIVKQARAEQEDVAIVLVTGEGLANSAPYLARARHLNVDAILRKPFDYDALLSVVNRLAASFQSAGPSRRMQTSNI